ncbi:helix-turn-helix domain-containing protein [bacterium]|nr:helix-turn-helix domain-containing protein [bacterium]
MSFGKAFGELIKRKRAAEGFTQQALAVAAFGDESYKTRISELENGKVSRPQAKTIDALIVALNISDQEMNVILNQTPHPQIVDNLSDFFDLNGADSLHIEVAIKTSGEAVLFHDCQLKVEIKRAEYFTDERMLVFLEESGRRRPVGLPLPEDVDQQMVDCRNIFFVRVEDTTEEAVEGHKYPLKIIR